MKDPQQVRSARTLEKILDACEVLLADRSFDAISMQDIAAEAGVSVGNLYNRFKDKNELVEYMTARHQQAFIAQLRTGLESQAGDLMLQQRLVYLAEFFREALKKLKPMFVTLATRAAGDQGPPAVAPEGTDEIVELVADWVMVRSDEMPAGVQRQRVEFAIASIAWGLQFNLVYGTPDRLFGGHYAKLLADQAYAYLTFEED